MQNDSHQVELTKTINVNGQSVEIDRDDYFYRKAVRAFFAALQALYEWRFGKKPPGIKDIFS